MTVKGKGENYRQSMRKYRYLHFQNTRKIQKKGEMGTKIQTIEYVLFLKLNVTDIPEIIYSVQITADLQFIA